MPLGGLLVGVGDLQHGLLAEGFADNLHAHGEAFAEAGRYGYSRNPSDIYRQGADIAEVHGEGVVHLLPYLEGDGGRGGSNQGVVLLKGGVELPPYQGAHLLGFEVPGVVVARR